MYESIEKWLAEVLVQPVPDAVEAFSFNLYDDGDGEWSMELIGASRFAALDADWACDEIADFGTREEPLGWHEDAEWADILEEAKAALGKYLEEGEYAALLKSRKATAVGFVDGELELLWCEAAQ